MKGNGSHTHASTGLQEPIRNRYYYGKLMDVHSFQQETNYFLTMQRLLNRVVIGYGVVCGLDVRKAGKEMAVIIDRGVAIDQCGRIIIVSKATQPIAIPDHVLPPPPEEEEETVEADDYSPEQQEKQPHKPPRDCPPQFIHVVLCYHECESDPAPVLTSDCESWGTCEAGAIRERYRVEFRRGKASRPIIDIGERFPDVIRGRELDYGELVQWVTETCPDCPDDPCIPLAEICLSYEDRTYSFGRDDINITVRPIVYSNDLLFNLLMALLTEENSYRRSK